MYVGLYSESTNPQLKNYKGLYRQNDLIDFSDSSDPLLKKTVKWFFKNSVEGNYMKYSEKSLFEIIRLAELLRLHGWNGDLIVFTDNYSEAIPMNTVFLGYDICADSRYYSPLGDGFIAQYDLHDDFYSLMKKCQYLNYRNSINQYGLFSDLSSANSFSMYCNTVNQIIKHSVESEDNWHPFALYSLQF